MNKIFISYRRNDSVGYSGRLADRLSLEFGENQVFRDYDDIKPGQNFVESLENGLSSADLLLVVIAENWLTTQNPTGQRRLDDENDFVRLEIEAALERDIHIIPVLINDVLMPNAQDLPTSLSALALRQAVPLSDSRWEQDVANLIENIRNLLNLKSHQPQKRKPYLSWLYSTATAFMLIAVFVSLFLKQTAFSGSWYFEGGDYLAISRQGSQYTIEHIDPAMQKTYAKGMGQTNGMSLEFNLEPIYTDRFKYQGVLKKSWDGKSLQGELLELLSDQRSELILKKQTDK